MEAGAAVAGVAGAVAAQDIETVAKLKTKKRFMDYSFFIETVNIDVPQTETQLQSNTF